MVSAPSLLRSRLSGYHATLPLRQPNLGNFRNSNSTLVHGFTHQDYTSGEGNNLNYTSVEKKNVIKETAICERKVTIFNLSQLASALKHDLRL